MGNIIKEKFILTLTYEMSVDRETGEILETKLIDRSVNNSDIKKPKATKKVVEEDQNEGPLIRLESNKYCLNSAALSVLNASAGDKLEIKYDKGSIPVIGKSESFGISAGNVLTKGGTVAYRGNKNEELSKFGTEFRLEKHPEKEGIFIMVSCNGPVEVKLEGDENIKIDEEDENIPFDLSLDGLVDDTDKVKEIDSSFFQL